MKKIVITGPECSGKTTLALQISEQRNAVYIPEVARPLLLLTDNTYTFEDLRTIAEYQAFIENSVIGCDKQLIVCDTSMLVLMVWSQYRFHRTHPFISNAFQKSDSVLWILCAPLEHWEADGLRVNENQRNELFEIYEHELVKAGKSMLKVPVYPPDQRLKWVLDHMGDL